ncbi:MAG: 4-diphosphocytidyl-2-C-methyl-D-erythritol kinase, partial [Gammaproteobacteria bacterium]
MSESKWWPAPAKINLFLHVTGRRADGYHELQTAYQFMDYCDWLKFEVTEESTVQRLTNPELPVEDLTVKAARKLKTFAQVAGGVKISIQKNLPSGAGLGGGSSDAATTLLVLNKLWKTGLTRVQLQEIGSQLGADVPVFVYGRAAWAEGIGDQFSAFSPDEGWYCVVKPQIHVNTVDIFCDMQLTRNTPEIRIRDFSANRSRNDLEAVTRRLYPEVDKVCRWLGNFGHARMSGSGAAVFVAVPDSGAGERILA